MCVIETLDVVPHLVLTTEVPGPLAAEDLISLNKVPGKDVDESQRDHLKSVVEKVRIQQSSGKETRVFETWKKFKHK